MVNWFFVNHVEVLVKHLKHECVLCAKQYFARDVSSWDSNKQGWVCHIKFGSNGHARKMK